MSYGAFVNACIQERTKALSGRNDPDFARFKRANDDFPDWPGHSVLSVLVSLRYPERPVSHSEVLRRLRAEVSPAERRAWLEDVA